MLIIGLLLVCLAILGAYLIQGILQGQFPVRVSLKNRIIEWVFLENILKASLFSIQAMFGSGWKTKTLKVGESLTLISHWATSISTFLVFMFLFPSLLDFYAIILIWVIILCRFLWSNTDCSHWHLLFQGLWAVFMLCCCTHLMVTLACQSCCVIWAHLSNHWALVCL